MGRCRGSLLILLLLLLSPLWAESTRAEDREGNTATVAVVEREGARFAAVTIVNPGKRKEATHLLTRKEISRVFLACKIAMKSKRPLEANEQVVVDSVAGEKARLNVVLVCPDEEVIGKVVVIENGRERDYILDKESYEKLASLLREAKSQLD